MSHFLIFYCSCSSFVGLISRPPRSNVIVTNKAGSDFSKMAVARINRPNTCVSLQLWRRISGRTFLMTVSTTVGRRTCCGSFYVRGNARAAVSENCFCHIQVLFAFAPSWRSYLHSPPFTNSATPTHTRNEWFLATNNRLELSPSSLARRLSSLLSHMRLCCSLLTLVQLSAFVPFNLVRFSSGRKFLNRHKVTATWGDLRNCVKANWRPRRRKGRREEKGDEENAKEVRSRSQKKEIEKRRGDLVRAYERALLAPQYWSLGNKCYSDKRYPLSFSHEIF